MQKYGDKKKIYGKHYSFHGRYGRKDRARKIAVRRRQHPGGFYCTVIKTAKGYELWMRKK